MEESLLMRNLSHEVFKNQDPIINEMCMIIYDELKLRSKSHPSPLAREKVLSKGHFHYYGNENMGIISIIISHIGNLFLFLQIF